MPDTTSTLAVADDLLRTVLDVSLTGVALLRPVFAENETTLVDFVYTYLNPAAQQMLRLPERPDISHLATYPATVQAGTFAFYRDTFESGQPGRYDVNYQHDGLDNYFHLSARRSGDLLVLSFTDTAEQNRSAVEVALRESQQREQAARADAERQRQQLRAFIDQAPVGLGFFEGPELRIGAANNYLSAMWGRTSAEVVGRPFLEAVPELKGQGFTELMHQVQATRVPFVGTEVAAELPRNGQLETTYYNFVYQPLYGEQGEIIGVIDVAMEVTEQVRARQQLQALTTELLEANHDLEAATSAVEQARTETERQRRQLYSILQQAPAMICIFDGPQHTFQFANPPYQALVGDRPIIGKPIAEAMPELAGQPIFDLLDQVYKTGETFNAYEMLVQLDHANVGARELEKRYYNFIYQARRNDKEAIDGIFVFAYDVTLQVQARQQVALQEERTNQLNEELAATNEELTAANEEMQAANEEINASNLELITTQAELRLLNQELEARVRQRTQALADALEETETQREQLQEQEQQLQLILGQVPAAVATLEGADHRYKFFNNNYQWLSGNRTQVGLTVAGTAPELAEQGFTDLLDSVYATGQPVTGFETPIMLYDLHTGQPMQHYVDFIYQPLLNNQTQTPNILVFVIDVTDRVLSRQRAEAAQAEALVAARLLATQRETYYRIFEQTPAAVAILRGPEHRLDYYNPAYRQLFPGRLHMGRTIAELQPEAVKHGFVALLDQVYQTGETHFGYEHRLLIEQANGQPAREVYFDFTYQAFQENDQPAGISVFAYEVTERVRARQQHEAQQQVLQRVFEQAPVAMGVFTGSDHIVEVCNPGLQAIWGRTAEQVLGKPLFEAMPEFVGQGFDKLLSEVLHTGVPYVAQEMPLRILHLGKMTTVYVNFVYQPLRDAQGQITAVAAVATDISEQVKARQVSEAAAHRLQLITDALPVLISYIDREERYQFVNSGYETWFGKKPDAFLGHTVRDVVGEAAYQRVEGYLTQALAGERLDFEARMPYREGFTKHIRTNYVPDVQAGQIVGIYTLVLDITAQVEAQQEAERQRQLLHTLFLDAPAAICIYSGPEQVYEFVNPSYQRIFPGRELLGRPVLEALPELLGTSVLEALYQVYKTGQTAVFQEIPLELARYAESAPEECFFTFTYQARRNGEGVVDGVLVFAYEVTDQVRARRMVEKSEQYLRRMADNVPAMIWLTDADGQCIYLNQQWYSYTGQTEAEGLGMGWLDAAHPDDMSAARKIFLDASTQQSPFSVLYRLRRQDGRYRWAVDSGQPRFNRDGQFDGFVGTVFDIHEQKQAEQALQRLTTNLRTARDRAQTLNAELQTSNEQLRRTNVDLDNFIYTASHDLKAPITNIEGLAHALQDQLPTQGELAEGVAPLLAMMQDSIERFQRTLDYLSDVTKLQKEHTQPTTPVELATIVEEVRLDLLPLLQASGTQLNIDVAGCPTIAFTPKNLRSVVYNLLSNAIKYRDPARPAEVRIYCRQEDGYNVLSVQDNGLGLDAGQQAELFTMFRRFHVGIEGSGIGLYMVKKIVENAGGKLLVSSTLGVGSTFSVYFRR